MTLADRLAAVEARIARACLEAGRDRSQVRLLAVTKTHPVAVVEQAYALGLREMGESRVAELADKADALGRPDLRWVMIGHVQRNKAAAVVRHAAEVQTLDSVSLAEVLDRRLAAAGRTLPVLVQVNVARDPGRSGVLPDEIEELTTGLRPYEALRPRGLMAIARRSDDPAIARADFAELRCLRDRLRDRDGGGWDELSMGMSGDLEAAVAEGSTCVRVGSDLFGARPPA